MGYSTIAGYLNRQGIPRLPSRNSHGRKFVDWSVHQIKRMLDNPVYTGRIAFGRTKMERIDGTENEYRRVKSDDYIMSDEVVHEPIISDELFEAARRKRQDMNNRLNKIYEEIYDIEDRITDSEKKKEAAQQDVLTKENVFKMLLVFDKIFDKMNDVDKRKLIESMIAEVHLHPKETWEEGKNPIKEIKYAFPVSKEVMKALRENVASVETVVLLSKGAKDPVDLCSVRTEVERRMVDSRKVKVDFSQEDMDLSEFKGKATYEQIKAYVLEQTGLKVSSLYIAQIKKKCGLDVGENFNLAKSENTRQPQCTTEKEEAIMQAFRHFGII